MVRRQAGIRGAKAFIVSVGFGVYGNTCFGFSRAEQVVFDSSAECRWSKISQLFEAVWLLSQWGSHSQHLDKIGAFGTVGIPIPSIIELEGILTVFNVNFGLLHMTGWLQSKVILIPSPIFAAQVVSYGCYLLWQGCYKYHCNPLQANDEAGDSDIRICHGGYRQTPRLCLTSRTLAWYNIIVNGV